MTITRAMIWLGLLFVGFVCGYTIERLYLGRPDGWGIGATDFLLGYVGGIFWERLFNAPAKGR